MFNRLLILVPIEAQQLLLVLFLSFLIGLEREEARRGGKRMFGGVRTFPLLGLMGYVVALLGRDNILGIGLGLLTVGAFMVVSYWHKLKASLDSGITTEVSGLLVYLVGAMVHLGMTWSACALVVICLFLLELKAALEGLAETVSPEEVVALTKFLLLSAVILPLVPDQEYSWFQINPFKTWLVVVAVCGVSYASYLLLKLVKGRGGIYLMAVLGGLYSSTITTLVLARRAAAGGLAHEYSGSILTASGMMYLRILVLVWLFNPILAHSLAIPFAVLAVLAMVGGWFWHRLPDAAGPETPVPAQPHNPLELRTAFLFALLFMLMLVATHLAVTYLGKGGVYSLAALMGVTDVDPFIMGMTHEAGRSTALSLAAVGILIATACNNLAKGCYAFSLARKQAGRWSLYLLSALALLGLLPILWV